MRQRLLNACAAVALVLGGWGGVLAGAACGHAHGAARASEHDCCRARTKAKTRKASHSSAHSSHSSTHSSTRAASSSSSHAAPRPASVQSGHCHAQNAPAARSHDDAVDSEARTADDSREVARAAAEPPAGFARQSAPCGHCVWRSGTPPAAPKVSDREGPRRADAAPAADARLATAAPLFSRFTPSAPARAAPPGPTRLHVLFNCFLI